ncbi:MAG TPA: PQQ-dependent sugar dehydrogenase [Vicinamibacterales bacterium]
MTALVARLVLGLGASLLLAGIAPSAQQPGGAAGTRRVGISVPTIGDGPWTVDTAEQHSLKVSVVTKALANPWSLAFLPDGSILVTERAGRLRIIRNGVLDPQPVAGAPEARQQRLGGLMDIVLHPRFTENRWVYLTYSKAGAPGLIATALARGTWDGARLVDTRDLFVATPWWDGNGGAASRLAFGRDGMLYMTTGASVANMRDAQEPGHHKGKVLRLRDDGTAPPDNPFASRAGFRPEIYSMGHRNQLGLAVHPQTGAVWANEQGPNGGDEINIILPGRNYGWPGVSLGRDYAGPWQGKWADGGFEPPLVFWSPSIAISGMAFYTGDRFPSWRGNVLVGAMRMGEIPGTGHLQRVVFNADGHEMRREMLLTELRQRIRDVRQGPDGLLYLLTDENPGALLRLEPAPEGTLQ